MLDLLVVISIFCENKIVLNIALVFSIVLLIKKIRKLLHLRKVAKYGKKR
nr:MAG TPA: hypothetical protein [Caudoviricetes sp.]